MATYWHERMEAYRSTPDLLPPTHPDGPRRMVDYHDSPPAFDFNSRAIPDAEARIMAKYIDMMQPQSDGGVPTFMVAYGMQSAIQAASQQEADKVIESKLNPWGIHPHTPKQIAAYASADVFLNMSGYTRGFLDGLRDQLKQYKRKTSRTPAWMRTHSKAKRAGMRRTRRMMR